MKNLKFIPNWKIVEILNHPYCQGIDGKDYGPFKEELQDIIWQREAKLDEAETNNLTNAST